MNSNFTVSLELACEIRKFEDEKFFLCLRDKGVNILFSAWLTKQEVNQSWDIISRTITQTVKAEIIKKLYSLEK